jgi:hypothetical protein
MDSASSNQDMDATTNQDIDALVAHIESPTSTDNQSSSTDQDAGEVATFKATEKSAFSRKRKVKCWKGDGTRTKDGAELENVAASEKLTQRQLTKILSHIKNASKEGRTRRET